MLVFWIVFLVALPVPGVFRHLTFLPFCLLVSDHFCFFFFLSLEGLNGLLLGFEFVSLKSYLVWLLRLEVRPDLLKPLSDESRGHGHVNQTHGHEQNFLIHRQIELATLAFVFLKPLGGSTQLTIWTVWPSMDVILVVNELLMRFAQAQSLLSACQCAP